MILVTNINWETDGEEVDLPTSITIHGLDELEAAIDAGDDYELTEYLSDEFGWLLNSYCYEILRRDENGLLNK